MILNKKQKEATMLALEWYYEKSLNQPLFVLGGYAGTGKSSTINAIIDTLRIDRDNVLFATLTGKASVVLRMKGLSASTIHKTFYTCRSFNGRVHFKRKPIIPRNIGLIVLDEFSMIPDNIIHDILSYGVPVIASGDPGQLPPLFVDNSYLTESNMDVMLSEVMRTDDKSGIIQLATMVRNKQIPRVGKYGRSRVLDDKSKLRKLSSYDKILCWTHKTRKYLNTLVREEKKIKAVYPIAGEVVNMLQNNYNYAIEYMGIPIHVINGLECITLKPAKLLKNGALSISLRPKFVKSKAKFNLKANGRIYDGYHEAVPELKQLILEDQEKERDYIYTDFAYCITTHSSQGSEYPNVLVLNEMPTHREEYFRHLYTSVTRASNSVDILL